MPEKPEVITVVGSLKTLILDKTITDCNVFWNNIIATPSTDEFKRRIINQKINSITTRGKFIAMELDRDYLLVHLRMEGKFIFRKPGAVIAPHEHVELILNGNISFRFQDVRKFGKMYLIDKDIINDVKPISELGLEYNDPNLTGDYLYNAIHKKRIAIKTVLLDQSIICGIGNIYDDEILFMCGISPLRRACDVTLEDCNNIVKNLVIVMEKAIKLGGTTIRSFTSSEGVHGRFQNELLVHGKAGMKCPVCGNKLLKIRVGGRGTDYCEFCQK